MGTPAAGRGSKTCRRSQGDRRLTGASGPAGASHQHERVWIRELLFWKLLRASFEPQAVKRMPSSTGFFLFILCLLPRTHVHTAVIRKLQVGEQSRQPTSPAWTWSPRPPYQDLPGSQSSAGLAWPCPGAAGRPCGPRHGGRDQGRVGVRPGGPQSHHLLLGSERGGLQRGA